MHHCTAHFLFDSTRQVCKYAVGDVDQVNLVQSRQSRGLQLYSGTSLYNVSILCAGNSPFKKKQYLPIISYAKHLSTPSVGYNLPNQFT